MRDHGPEKESLTRNGISRRYKRGMVTIEFALAAPLIMLLLAGALDFGRVLRASICVADAARAGAQYGSLSSANSSNLSGMQTAALNAAPDIIGMTAVAVKSCKCSGGASVSCSGSCVGGKMLVYVQVTAQMTCSSVFGYPGLGYSGTISSSASMRAQ
jgi:Flp pilus assembly protein TadG